MPLLCTSTQGYYQNDARATGIAAQVQTLRLDALNAAVVQ
jgi:hypothetical protein